MKPANKLNKFESLELTLLWHALYGNEHDQFHTDVLSDINAELTEKLIKPIESENKYFDCVKDFTVILNPIEHEQTK